MTVTISKIGIGQTWTLLLDGATNLRFGVQLASSVAVRLAIASAAPDEDTTVFVLLERDGTREFSEELAATDKVYVKRVGRSAGALRGFRVPR